MNVIWATRGRSWGFRFLLDGGLADPLPTYDRAFAGVEHERLVSRRAGDLVALRFPDPDGRRDRAGRVIPHDLVLLESPGGGERRAADERDRLWATLADAYAQLWEWPRPPAPADVRQALGSLA